MSKKRHVSKNLLLFSFLYFTSNFDILPYKSYPNNERGCKLLKPFKPVNSPGLDLRPPTEEFTIWGSLRQDQLCLRQDFKVTLDSCSLKFASVHL